MLVGSFQAPQTSSIMQATYATQISLLLKTRGPREPRAIEAKNVDLG